MQPEMFFEFIKDSYIGFKSKDKPEEFDSEFWGGMTKEEVEASIDEAEASGCSGLTHDEVFDQLFKKYDLN